jgi:nucleotide-binding universal stress UspA family protein
MRLLVALDGSEHELRALRWVLDRRGDWQTPPELHLLNVQPPVASGLVRRFVSEQAIQDYLREEGEAALAEQAALLDAAGAQARVHLGVGPLAPTIVAHARASACDAIVIGTRGAGGVRAALLGSTVKRVLEAADRPVWVVP